MISSAGARAGPVSPRGRRQESGGREGEGDASIITGDISSGRLGSATVYYSKNRLTGRAVSHIINTNTEQMQRKEVVHVPWISERGWKM